MVMSKARSNCIDLGETTRSLEYTPGDRASAQRSAISESIVQEKENPRRSEEVMEEEIQGTSRNSLDESDMDYSPNKATENVSFHAFFFLVRRPSVISPMFLRLY